MTLEDTAEELRGLIDEIAQYAHGGVRRLLDEALAKVVDVEDLLARAQAAADSADAFQDALP